MPDAPLILIVEDEKPICRFLRASLSGHDYRIVEAQTGKDALLMINTQPPDLIILDLGLPDMDGLDIIDQVRQWSRLPIIILSARDQENDKVNALDRGADDYLTKPFGVDELLAWLRVALRHQAHGITAQPGGGTAAGSGVFEMGKVHVDLEQRVVTVHGQTVHLTPIEYRLLTTLIAQAGKVLTHRFLLREVWGRGHADEAHTLRVHMANLRRKLEADPARPRHVMTEQGVGYRLLP